MLKVLEICTGFPLSFQGGITNYVRALADELYACGNSVYVLGDKDENNCQFTYVEYTSKINGFVYGPLKDQRGLMWLKDFLSKERFDIVHIHMCINMDWDLYDVVKKYKYIISLHDYFYICPRITMMGPSGVSCDRYDQEKCRKCISYLHRFKLARFASNMISTLTGKREFIPYLPQNITVERYAKFKELLTHAAYVLPVSNRVQEIYINSGIEANYKTLHIGNISANLFDNVKICVSEDSYINMVFLGRLSYYKGVEILLAIADQIDKSKIRIHFWGYSGKYKDVLKMQGIFDHGKYRQVQLPEILSEMDIGLVLPIWEDNGPQVVMEMLNNKLPVIATCMGGITDFVNNDNGFLFDPYSKDGVYSVVNYINNLDKQRILDMKKKIVRTLTPKEHCNKLLNLYEEVAHH